MSKLIRMVVDGEPTGRAVRADGQYQAIKLIERREINRAGRHDWSRWSAYRRWVMAGYPMVARKK